MNKKLTDNYNFVSQFDSLAADIYIDRKHFFVKPKDIAKYRNLSLSKVESLHAKAKELLKNREQAWMYGLSKRARLAIKAAGKYNDFKDLYNDVMTNNVDLEELPKIGHKVALEVHGWIIKKKAC